MDRLFLIIPFGSAVAYALAALILKRGVDMGIGPWRTTFVSNVFMGLIIGPLFFFSPWTVPSEAWLPLVFGSFLFFIGQILTFLALSKGDASLATPLMGSKALFVAVFTVVGLQQNVPLLWWVAAGLTVLALLLLQGNPFKTPKAIWATMAYSFASAATYACVDLVVQESAPRIGFFTYVPLLFTGVALWSVLLIPFFHAPLQSIGWDGWKVLIPGSILLGLQALGIAVSLGVFGEATAVNIVYSSRGLCSVLLVWWIGSFLATTEADADASELRSRGMGAAVLLVAIALVLLERPAS